MRLIIPITLAAAATAAFAPTVAAAPPSNDAFESPETTTGSIRGAFTEEGTRQDGEPEHGFKSLWYAYRAPVSGRMAVQPAPGQDSATATVYEGESLSTIRRVSELEQDIYRTTFEAVAGTVYRIVATTPYDGVGTFGLRIVPAPLPANDDFVAAQPVKIPGRYQGNLVDATDELGEPDHAGAKPQRSLWYRFRAARTGRLSIQASSRGCDPSVTVYTGSKLSSLRRRASASGRTLRFTARRGQTYRLALDCGYRSLDGFELTISDGSIAGKGVTIEPVAGQTVDGVIERGLRTVVQAKRKTTVGIELVISRATARELGIERRVIGSVRGTLGYRQKLPATIRLTGEARKALAGRDSLSAVLRLTLLKTNAPNRVTTVPVEIPN